MLVAGLTLLAEGAKADCDVPDPEFLTDTLHSNLGPRSAGSPLRSALAESGISVAGVYYAEAFSNTDLPPLKWSSLKYGFGHGGYDGKEEAYS